MKSVEFEKFVQILVNKNKTKKKKIEKNCDLVYTVQDMHQSKSWCWLGLTSLLGMQLFGI